MTPKPRRSTPTRARRGGWWSLCAVAVGAGIGCTSTPATEVIVEISADAALLADASSLHVAVTDDEGQTVLDRTTEVAVGGDRLARVPLVPRGGDPSRTFVLRAELLGADSSPLAALEAHAGYVDHELRLLSLSFEADCTGKLDCGAGRTCFEGRCVGACFTPEPAEGAGPSHPTCKECQICAGSCEAADAIPCGCPGETCAAGACTPSVSVLRVEAGSRHTCAVVGSGDVYCWGSTTFDDGKKGRLGTGTTGTDSAAPVLVGTNGTDGITVSPSSTCAFAESRRSCWGINRVNELGGTIEDVGDVVSEPHTFNQGFSLEVTASGFRHVCGLTADHDLWCWGYNGRANISSDMKPVPVPTLAGAKYVKLAAGGDHTCAIDASGALWCWGYNDSGEAGVTGGDVVASPTRAGCDPDASQKSCFHDWKTVGAGLFHTCAIRDSGELFCWGGNANGQLGTGAAPSAFHWPEPTPVKSSRTWIDVSGGWGFTCAIDSDLALSCWGSNTEGQAGMGDEKLVGVPTLVETEDVGGWRSLGLGEYHACAIRADRTLWCWGRNSDGQVGIGEATEAAVTHPRRVCFGETR